MIQRAFSLMVCILLFFAILSGCTKTTEIVPLPLPPTDTQVPVAKTSLKPMATQVLATNTLLRPTDTPKIPTQTIAPSPIYEFPITERISAASAGTQGNFYSKGADISADGRFVALAYMQTT